MVLKVIDGEIATQLGMRCIDCGSKYVVYAISKPILPAFPEGAYCYKCLLTRCRYSHMIPMPIPEQLLDMLKADLGLTPMTKFYTIKEKGD